MDYQHGSASWPSQQATQDRSCQLYIRDYPHRSIAIVSNSHALVIRYTPSTNESNANGSVTSLASGRPRSGSVDASAVAKCMVEFTPRLRQPLQDYRALTPRPIFGTLGLISVNGDVFLCVVTQATRTATVRPGETIEKISNVAFFCLNTSEYDDVVSVDIYDPDGPDMSSAYGQNLSRRDVPIEHPCHELRKLLSNGSFYYSTDFDVTNRIQDR
jgi:synaptojanin